MMPAKESFIPKPWNRLNFRIGSFLALSIVVADVISTPLYLWVDSMFHPEDHAKWKSSWSAPEVLTYFGLTVAYALILGTLLGKVAARLFSRRIRKIADHASGNLGLAVPEPFPETGKDEVTQLAQALNAMRRRISELVADLKDRDSKRKEWIAQVSHDLRTPLTALITSLDHGQRLLDRQPIALEDLSQTYTVARLDAERVASMAEDLLEIARLEIDQIIQKEEVLPGEIMEHAVQGLAPLAREAGVTLEIELQDDLPPLEADGRLLLRALENLLMNSVQHASTKITVIAHADQDQLLLEVLDDGPGFPKEDGFISFQALKNHRSRPDSAGLGLLVAQRVAQVHGGCLKARNRKPSGAAVGLSLPVSAPASSVVLDSPQT
ncbi:MAG: sensor histidine kinase [Planctomycetota bacterium]|nr:MAG: sensor histidine kinase [Planctomycetota bacterium]